MLPGLPVNLLNGEMLVPMNSKRFARKKRKKNAVEVEIALAAVVPMENLLQISLRGRFLEALMVALQALQKVHLSLVSQRVAQVQLQLPESQSNQNHLQVRHQNLRPEGRPK
jgi:hypothetical protein